MAGNALCDVALRMRVTELHDEGAQARFGRVSARRPRGNRGKWLDIYRSVGIEALALVGTKKTVYLFETKVASVRAVADEGMIKPEAMTKFGIASPSAFKKRLKADREGSPETPGPKPKDRPRGSSSPPKAMTRKQELKRRVERFEAENAYLKKSIALKAEKRF